MAFWEKHLLWHNHCWVKDKRTKAQTQILVKIAAGEKVYKYGFINVTSEVRFSTGGIK